MISRSLSYAVDGQGPSMFGPIGASIAAHFLLVGLVFFSPVWDSEPEFIPSVIDVQMVDLSDLKVAPAQKEVSPKAKSSVVKEKKAEVEVAPEPATKTESAKKPEVSVAPPKKSSKSALKYKTFKTKEVLKNALKRVEKRVDTSRSKPLVDTIKKLREKVAKEGRPGPVNDDAKKSDAANKAGAFGHGSKKEIELVDLYRLEIVYTIQKNWAFAEQLSGRNDNLEALVVIKVMPNGEISDIFFTDRSGNQYLDDSAYRAIVKSSPVRPHPEKLSRPYVELGLRFGPKGLQ